MGCKAESGADWVVDRSAPSEHKGAVTCTRRPERLMLGLTTGVKLRGPEGAQRPRATSASTSELGCSRLGTCRQVQLPVASSDSSSIATIRKVPIRILRHARGDCPNENVQMVHGPVSI
jgi:hypothetical protein